jgi:hypothetical protein
LGCLLGWATGWRESGWAGPKAGHSGASLRVENKAEQAKERESGEKKKIPLFFLFFLKISKATFKYILNSLLCF